MDISDCLHHFVAEVATLLRSTKDRLDDFVELVLSGLNALHTRAKISSCRKLCSKSPFETS